MTPEALAELHALAFTDTPPPWPAPAFATLLGNASTLLATRPDGFALGRLAGPEAELLTLAVHPARRRRGIGRELVAEFEALAEAAGGREVFLEVAESNAPARALYAQLGYAPAGRRLAYYTPRAAPPIDALILRKLLRHNNPDRGGKTIDRFRA